MCVGSGHKTSLLLALSEICLRGVIHYSRKPCEALPSEVFQVVAKVIKGQRAGKGHILFFRPDHKGLIRSPEGFVPT